MNKPRIKKQGELWRCFNNESSAVGYTPKQAYCGWLKIRNKYVVQHIRKITDCGKIKVRQLKKRS